MFKGLRGNTTHLMHRKWQVKEKVRDSGVHISEIELVRLFPGTALRKKKLLIVVISKEGSFKMENIVGKILLRFKSIIHFHSYLHLHLQTCFHLSFLDPFFI